MNGKQKEFKKLIPECPKCKLRMHERYADWDAREYKRRYESEKDDAIQNDVLQFVCYNCNTSAFVLRKTQVQTLDDELIEYIIPKPTPEYHYIDTIYDLPEKAEDHEFFYIKKGYYNNANCENGVWKYWKDNDDVKRCEDCIYFKPFYKELRVSKERPNSDGSPNGTCKQELRLRDDCPLWDKGE